MSPDSTVWVIRFVALQVHVAVNSNKANMAAISFLYLVKIFMDKNSKFYTLFFLQIRFRVFLWDIPVFIKYRAFYNVLRNYKHLLQENQRTYLNGTVHSQKKSEQNFFFITRSVRYVHHG